MSRPDRGRSALWVSTATTTRGGVASFVRVMQTTPLWTGWHIRHIATHRDGSMATKIGAFLRAWAQLLSGFLWHRPDLVHIHMASYGSFYRKCSVVAFARLMRIPIVLHIHGSEFHSFHARSPRLTRIAIRASLECADVVIALGETWRLRLTEIAPKADVIVVANATHMHEPVSQPPAGSPVEVLFLGRIGNRKGTFELIDAWAGIGPEPHEAHLTIAGDGEVDRARELVDSSGAADTVSVRGWMNADETRAVLSRSQIFVLPSHNEGQPMAILEAMAHGLCVIATDTGGIADLLDGGDAGVLLPVGDLPALERALERAITDADDRAAVAGRGFRRASDEFDAVKVSGRLDEIYRKVIR
ncbi:MULTISPECIES: glycosyltransferase family 4 protein [Gordonia]|uniref:Glycosyltransferase family 4 protein n=1 Tax=Gordonia tangerina TaxID=2911060 RepID=A0ABS9DLN0_9ACTN|nr:glycosyltransferase family 4 protein [Gordonia tangerina]MCF3940144.1 glycosyltransferase family 4 protein [Gordonia tangerina]